MDDCLLAFDDVEGGWRRGRISNNREFGFEDLSDDVSVAHQMDRKCLVHGVIDPLVSALVRIVQKMVAYVVEKVAHKGERNDFF